MFHLKLDSINRYNYLHRSSTSPWPSWTGSIHGDEIEYVFGFPLKRPEFYSQEEVKFAEDVVNLWTNFAKSGYDCLTFVLLEGNYDIVFTSVTVA